MPDNSSESSVPPHPQDSESSATDQILADVEFTGSAVAGVGSLTVESDDSRREDEPVRDAARTWPKEAREAMRARLAALTDDDDE